YSTCYKVLGSTGAQTHTWTSPSGGKAAVIATFSGVATSNSGSNVYLTGHQCNDDTGGTRRASWSCVMPVKSGNRVVIVGNAHESDIGPTDCAGFSDSLSSTYSYAIASANATGTKICYMTAGSTALVVFTFAAQSGGTGWTAVQAYEFTAATTPNLDV